MALIRHRITARVLLQADTGRFLLFLTHWSPGSGLEPRWVTPGGGVEPGEDFSLAASREVAEETGLRLQISSEIDPIRRIAFTQHWQDGNYETGEAVIFHHRVANEFEPSRQLWTAEERRDILEHRWWQAQELFDSGEQVGPPGLVNLMVELG